MISYLKRKLEKWRTKTTFREYGHSVQTYNLPKDGKIDFAVWLNPETTADRLKAIMRPYPSERMRAHPVSRRLNDVRNDDEECIAPEPEERQGALL